jgi:hypothetical protein
VRFFRFLEICIAFVAGGWQVGHVESEKHMNIIQELNEICPGSEICRLANEGKFAESASYAFTAGWTLLWKQIRAHAGLPVDDAARSAEIAAGSSWMRWNN